MIELVDYDIRLEGERVGVFIGTPSDRMKLNDALSCLVLEDELEINGIKFEIHNQIIRLNDAVAELLKNNLHYDLDDDESLHKIKSVIADLESLSE